MSYETEITDQEGIISRLQTQLRQARLPARTINWQHNNIGYTRNIAQRILIERKKRSQIKSGIKQSRNKIISLRKAILGVE